MFELVRVRLCSDRRPRLGNRQTQKGNVCGPEILVATGEQLVARYEMTQFLRRKETRHRFGTAVSEEEGEEEGRSSSLLIDFWHDRSN